MAKTAVYWRYLSLPKKWATNMPKYVSTTSVNTACVLVTSALGSKLKLVQIRHRLGSRSPLLRATQWRILKQQELKSLIQRFATRERKCFRHGRPGSQWRRKRLSAVHVYTSRFGEVPAIFKQYRLPDMTSYYYAGGAYVWPRATQHTLEAERPAFAERAA
jgi:hypothetical protein